MGDKSLLTVRDLTVYDSRDRRFLRSKPVEIVRDIRFDVEHGERVGLVGVSGAGKSTIAKALVGMRRHVTGSVRFDGHEMLKQKQANLRPLRSRLQLVLQNPASLGHHQSVRSLLEEPLTNFDYDRETWAERITEVLAQVSLEASLLDRYPQQLSGGQQQRVSIARSLLLDPELLILDEPVSALDRIVQLSILDDLLRRNNDDGMTFILITHDDAVARYSCDRYLRVDGGRIVSATDV